MTPFVTWNVDPEAISTSFVHVRWYGLFFATAFMAGHEVIRRMFIREKISLKKLDVLFFYMVGGTLLGARLGHCFFYEPQIYLAEPLRVFKIWEGGLASHGAMVGILAALLLYRKKFPEFSLLYLFDRIGIAVALCGFFVRIGNLFNSEIYGKPTDLPWAFVFSRIDALPRHPTQIYEALAYLAVFGFFYRMYWKTDAALRQGYLFGGTLVGIFGARLLVEFCKENQEAFESSLPLNMGQLLSVPLILIGIYLMVRANRAFKRG